MNEPSWTLIEQVWTSNRKGRADIVLRGDGLFHVCVHREFSADGEFQPESYFAPVGHEAILTDSLERARSLAEDEFRVWNGFTSGTNDDE